MDNQQRVVNYFAIAVLLILAALLITGCNRTEPSSPYQPYQEAMNNQIVELCDQYRSSEHNTRESIRARLEQMMQGYDGRIDYDAEYCLNSMDVHYRR